MPREFGFYERLYCACQFIYIFCLLKPWKKSQEIIGEDVQVSRFQKSALYSASFFLNCVSKLCTPALGSYHAGIKLHKDAMPTLVSVNILQHLIP